MDIDEGKEMLTPIIIKKELMKILSYDFISTFIMWPVLGLFLWGISHIFQHFTFYNMLIIIFALITLLGFFIDIVSVTRLFYQFKNERYAIKKAILYKKEEQKGIKGRGLYNRYVPPKLFFDRCGCHNVLKITYYKWSRAYSMTSNELFETSRIDDYFTLVTLKNKILMVYNNKFFDTSSLQYSE